MPNSTLKPKTKKKKTPQVGFEPTTNRLTAERSTTELLRIEAYKLLSTIMEKATSVKLEFI
jgi:hypothetical protein|tara:strand:+ start:1453 stop:1635 length:183 start_codon:yes stop_codon:yes gene_type:complete